MLRDERTISPNGKLVKEISFIPSINTDLLHSSDTFAKLVVEPKDGDSNYPVLDPDHDNYSFFDNINELGNLETPATQTTKPSKQPPGPKIHICDLCSSSYAKKHGLYGHTEKKHPEHEWHCADCNFVGKTQEYRKHREEHKSMIDHPCPTCGTICDSRKKLQDHRKEQHFHWVKPAKRKWKCKVCRKECESHKALWVHNTTEHDMKYSCEVCGIFDTFSAFINHSTSHPKEWSCPDCDFICKSKKEYYKHRNAKHKTKYQCNDCNEVFISIQKMKTHSITTHNKPLNTLEVKERAIKK